MWSAGLLTLICNGHIDYGAVDLPCTYLQFTATERYIFIFLQASVALSFMLNKFKQKSLIF